MNIQKIVLLDTLKQWHYVVDKILYTSKRSFIHVCSLKQCLDYIRKENISLLLYDVIENVNTEGFSGFLQEIENAQKIIPIVFLVDSAMTISYTYPFSSIIEKPLHSVVLKDIVQEILT